MKKPPKVIMGKTHTNILHRFGYHRTKSRKRKGLFKKIIDTEYFEHAKGYGFAKRDNGAWRHCGKRGKRKGRGHGPEELEEHLTRFHGPLNGK